MMFLCSKTNAQTFKKFLRKDSTAQNTFLTGSLNFMYTINGKVIQGGRGTCFSAGINLARLFSKKIVLGFVVDMKIEKGFWPSQFSNTYQSDFNKAFKVRSLIPSDSSKANLIYELVNGKNDPNASYSSAVTLQGSAFIQYGIMYSPYPQKYGGVLVKIQRGSYTFPVHGIYGDAKIKAQDADFAHINLPTQFRAELSFKPLLLLRSSASDHLKPSKLRFLNYLVMSIYYERLSFQDADIEKFKFNEFLAPWFISKYAIDEHFGVKLSLGLY
jgi:hypothetical protein